MKRARGARAAARRPAQRRAAAGGRAPRPPARRRATEGAACGARCRRLGRVAAAGCGGLRWVAARRGCGPSKAGLCRRPRAPGGERGGPASDVGSAPPGGVGGRAVVLNARTAPAGRPLEARVGASKRGRKRRRRRRAPRATSRRALSTGGRAGDRECGSGGAAVVRVGEQRREAARVRARAPHGDTQCDTVVLRMPRGRGGGAGRAPRRAPRAAREAAGLGTRGAPVWARRAVGGSSPTARGSTCGQGAAAPRGPGRRVRQLGAPAARKTAARLKRRPLGKRSAGAGRGAGGAPGPAGGAFQQGQRFCGWIAVPAARRGRRRFSGAAPVGSWACYVHTAYYRGGIKPGRAAMAVHQSRGAAAKRVGGWGPPGAPQAASKSKAARAVFQRPSGGVAPRPGHHQACVTCSRPNAPAARAGGIAARRRAAGRRPTRAGRRGGRAGLSSAALRRCGMVWCGVVWCGAGAALGGCARSVVSC